ncbi:hypothetical protein QQP08_025849 [Theobroma cacao]|nr:hypothetical protein QQP08_025849 [Theobroma cacao]
MGDSNASVDEDLLLKEFFAEFSEVERDNEVISCFLLDHGVELRIGLLVQNNMKLEMKFKSVGR